MRYRSPQMVIAFVFTLLFAAANVANAGLIVAGSTYLQGTAVMDLTLLPNTPFNPTSSSILLSGVSGNGSITLNRNMEVGTTITIPTLAGGQFYGSNAALGTYVFGNIPPLTGASFSGSITNVVQNPNDPGFATGQPSSFQSGNFLLGGNSFGFEFLTGPAAGVTLFTDPAVPFQFSSVFNGLPPTAGTVLANSGPDVLNVLYGNTVVATTSDRFIALTAVPEPSSVALLGIFGVIAIGAYARGRHRRAGV